MKRFAKRALVVTAACAAVVALGLGGLTAAWLAGIKVPFASGATYVEIVKLDAARAAGEPEDGLVFIALIGNDYRTGVGGARGDALHLVGINVAQHTATMLDFPRDICYSGGKINSQHSVGGPRAQADALGALAGVQVDYAVSVDFDGFIGLVDGVGGLDIDVLEPMNDRYSGAVFDAGEQQLTGVQALAYSRNRHDFPSSDIKRTENQGYLILEGLAQLQDEMDSPTGKFRIMATLWRHAELDNLGIGDLFRLGEVAFRLDPAAVRNVVVPTSGGGCSGGLTFAGADLAADFADDAILQSH